MADQQEEPIGKVTHYFGHVSAAVIELAPGKSLNVGDRIRIKGHSEDFEQDIGSLQVEHEDVDSVKAGDDFAVKVDQKVHEGSEVFKA
jgi:hypothetical protein